MIGNSLWSEMVSNLSDLTWEPQTPLGSEVEGEEEATKPLQASPRGRNATL